MTFEPLRRSSATPLAGFVLVGTLALTLCETQIVSAKGAPAPTRGKSAAAQIPSAAGQAAMQYAEAMGHGDRARLDQLDFSCLFLATPAGAEQGGPSCHERLVAAHLPPVVQAHEGVHGQWPGPGRTVFFSKPLPEYVGSAFLMELLGQSPPGSGFDVRVVREQPIPSASFPSRDGKSVVSAPTTLVRLNVTYKDPLTSPLTHVADTYKFASTVSRPRLAIHSIDVQLPVVTGLKKLGYPSDAAILNIPVAVGGRVTTAGLTQAIPFSTEKSRIVDDSVVAWKADDMPGVLLAAVARAVLFPELEDRMSLLNRVLLIDPRQPEALNAVANELYVRVLSTGDAAPPPLTKDPTMARRLAEISWNVYAQTTRTDLSLDMEVGGFSKPTAADFLYRMIPAMDMLAQVRPNNLDNRMHLGIAYRWNNDQVKSITTHQALANDMATARPDQHARALTELAWSRISKVAWNRIMDDRDIQLGFDNAKEAANVAQDPLEKSMAYYAMAFSQLFMPNRDTAAMAAHLTESKKWFDLAAGANPVAWKFLLGQETLKALLDADPTFDPIRTASGWPPVKKADAEPEVRP
ncbi:MAG: hypothetical protein U0172_11635 [Nitrospiraceae bacterium]